LLQEPPLCAHDPEFDAIVVSEETVPGAHAINQVELGEHTPNDYGTASMITNMLALDQLTQSRLPATHPSGSG
jgi:hypothetical protein